MTNTKKGEEFLEGLSAADRRFFKRFGTVIFRSLRKEFVRTGVIDPAGLSISDLDKKVAEYVLSIKGKWDFHFVIDHTSTLLRHARQMVSAEKFELALLFYATWLEHWLNHAVAHTVKQHGGSQDAVSSVIRGTSLEAKLHLVPILMGSRSLSKTHRVRIIRVADLRNAFVHYKWKAQQVDLPDPHDEEKALREIEKTIRYLVRYEYAHIYKGMKLRQAATSHPTRKGPVLVHKKASSD